MYTPRNLKHKLPSSITQMDHNKKGGILFLILSFVVHGAVFGAMVFFQDFTFPKPMPPVIQVDLVSFAPDPVFDSSDDAVDSSTKKGVPFKGKVKKSTPKKIKHIKADISLKTKPKNIKELIEKQKQKKKKPPEKKKEKKPVEKPEKKIDTQKELEKARQKLAKKVEDKNKSQISAALSRLQKKIKNRKNSSQGTPNASQSGRMKRRYKPIDLYNLEIEFAVKQNWVYSDIFANMDQKLQVVILIKILASGEIRDVIYETKSGNRYLDESAKKAIVKINPLPKLPPGMRSYDLGLIFTPKGLK